MWNSAYGLQAGFAVLLGIVLTVFGAAIGTKAATIAAAPPEQRPVIVAAVRRMSALQLLTFVVVFTLMVCMRFGI